MKNKKSLTESILKDIGGNININKVSLNSKKIDKHKDNYNKEIVKEANYYKLSEITTQNLKDNNEVKLDLNAFIMLPINHPKINEIINLLNNFENENNKEDLLEKSKKIIITLNDILNSNRDKLITSKNSIITPMAKDYIKQNKIEVVFIENKEK